MPDVIADLDRDERRREAEITPEMVEAGVKAFFPFDRRYDEIDGAIKRVWRAMWLAMLEGQVAPGKHPPPDR